MPSLAHPVTDLAAAIQRVAAGDSCLDRLEGLVDQARKRGEATDDLSRYLADIRLLQACVVRNAEMQDTVLREQARVAALQALNVLDSSEERAYDDLTRMAATLCGTPIALVSLVDESRQWLKSRVGLQAKETDRALAFCAHAIQTPTEVMVVKDARADPRFVDNALVTGDPNIRFYAGAPLVTSDGHALGTLCVIDTVPRDIHAEQLEELRFLASQVIATLEKRRS